MLFLRHSRSGPSQWKGALLRRIEWVHDVLKQSSAGRFLLDCGQAASLVVHGFRGEKIGLRASALTYITILSLVPLLAVVFAIVRGLGQEELRHSVHEFVFSNLAPGTREQIGHYLDGFIAQASSGAMGGFGAFFLLLSAVGLFHNIERSLNDIWGVQRPRPLMTRVILYWSVLTLGPIALGASLFATSMARSLVEHSLPSEVIALISPGTSILLFFFLYIAVPYARVSLRAALGGALVAGCAWEIAKHGYAAWAANSFRYSVIYGSLGTVPLFLIWVYLSWLIVLFGARLSYALQYATAKSSGWQLESTRAREVLCARVALAVVGDYLNLVNSTTAWKIADLLQIERQCVAQVVELLISAGILAETSQGGLVPALPPERIRLWDISQVARGRVVENVDCRVLAESTVRSLFELFAQADQEERKVLESVSLAKMAEALISDQTAGLNQATNRQDKNTEINCVNG